MFGFKIVAGLDINKHVLQGWWVGARNDTTAFHLSRSIFPPYP